MNEYVSLRVADTRFAIKCNHEQFNEWLEATYGGFLSRETPDLRLDMAFGASSPDDDSRHTLSVTPAGQPYQHGTLRFNRRLVTCGGRAHPEQFFGLITQIGLRCAVAARQVPDLLLHAAGILHQDLAYIFTGDSGAGKSTVCSLFSREDSFTVLHDEVIAVSNREMPFYAWSTPIKGEHSGSVHRGGPLRGIFFLEQDTVNFIERMTPSQVVERLCFSLIPPFVVKNHSLAADQKASLGRLLVLAENIHGYKLHFLPDRSFWNCISDIFEEACIA